METSYLLVVCILVTCSVWTVQGVHVHNDDQEQMEISAEARKLPGLCWVCKWALNKVKSKLTSNETAQRIGAKLNHICNQIGLLKKPCYKFVKANFDILVEELTTTDNVRTICVNIKACKSKELLEQLFNQNEEDSLYEMNEYHSVGVDE